MRFLNYGKEIAPDGNLCDFFNVLISIGKVGQTVEVAEKEMNINTPEDLSYAENLLRTAV